MAPAETEVGTFGMNSASWTVLRPMNPPLLQRMLLYQGGKAKYYLLAYNGEETACSLLTFTHLTPEKLRVTEDPKCYSPKAAEALVEKMHQMNAAEGGLQLVCEAFGLLGCFRFLECYYLLLVTKRRPLGIISGHCVYGIADSVLVPLDQPLDSAAEKKYRKLFLSGMDLTKDFFFSYSYNICYTVQYNMTHEDPQDPFNSMFVWNEFLSRGVRNMLGTSQWVLPLVHGCWQQRCLAVLGQMITVTLIARRSRRFAGTRYLKRGVCQNGWVANEVETEQIVGLGTIACSLSSVVQLRGSIPLFWGQDALTLNPRPNIVLQNTDPLYEATGKHFEDLHDRYGGPIVVLNLVKSHEKQPRETILRKEFGKAIGFLNKHVCKDDHIVYIPWDFKEHMSKDGRLFLRDIEPVIQTCIASTGLCAVGPATARLKMRMSRAALEPQLQQGVLRTNCIDCLDRTNICQFAYGVVALGHQLHTLGVLGTDEINPDCSLAYQLMEMYENMGNVLAWQYGGSEAHGTFFDRMRGQSEAATQSRDMVTSLKRYYSNTITDMEKQHAINLFLGNFIPNSQKTALWDLESDHYLHNAHASSASSLSSVGSTNSISQLPSFRSCASSASFHGSSIDIAEDFAEQRHVEANTSPKPQFAGSVGRFPVPVVSQTGQPDAMNVTEAAEQSNRSKKESTWKLSSIFKATKETKVEFRPPKAMEGSLVSFDEMLSTCPIIHVRLHDSQSNTFRGLRGLSFHRSFSRIAKQDALLESDYHPKLQIGESGEVSRASDFADEYAISSSGDSGGLARVASLTKHAKSGLQALKERSKRLTRLRHSSTHHGLSFTAQLSDKKAAFQKKMKRLTSFPRRAATPPSGAYRGYAHAVHNRHLGARRPASARGSFGNRSGFSQTPPSSPPPPEESLFDSEMAKRSYSVPMGVHDIEPEDHSDVAVNKDVFAENQLGRIWADYLSITPESVAREMSMEKQTHDSVWGLIPGYPDGPRTGWSAEDCWNDIFSGTLETFQIQHARQKHPWDVEERLKCLQLRAPKSLLSHDSTKPMRSLTSLKINQPDGTKISDSEEAAVNEKSNLHKSSIERKSVTFVDSKSESGQLEKWWGTS